MATTPSTTSTSKSHQVTRLAVVAVVASLLAFGIGRLTSDGEPAGRRTRTAAEPARRPTAASDDQRGWPSQAPAASPAQAAAPGSTEAAPATAPAPAARGGAPTQALITRVAEETQVQLESAQPELYKKCWPQGGLPKGRTSTKLTFSVVYDAAGNEVARGISEDRRAPAGALATCLRRLPLGTLRVEPPGASVGVRVALAFP